MCPIMTSYFTGMNKRILIDYSQLSKCYSPGSMQISTSTDDPFTAGFMLVIVIEHIFQLIKVKIYAFSSE